MFSRIRIGFQNIKIVEILITEIELELDRLYNITSCIIELEYITIINIEHKIYTN